ncbi:uncharacterized protein N7518_002752 [Penicillium psychrosexuale]|uniref:uncharacterized protein n=1 Tax=Penicillium psychrosexuale TaxID=1002107 RepID=UPI0025450E9C|nr:uncharacterized protein N7518_002752 [Penicillium psychrosexuale]KAJ5800684.1 hypothetical protein N7518_002752 [Penicillium psychrosexuale]
MDTLAKLISDHFLHYDEFLADQLDILAIVFSGSAVYYHAERSTLDQARDFDGAILVKGRGDIATLLNDKRPLLKRLLAMQREEHPSWDLSADSLQSVDGVRFAGWTSNDVKLSYKILSLESFSTSPGVTHLLSRKDRRVYEGYTSEGWPTLRVQQATKIKNHTVVLHDNWVLDSTFIFPTGSKQDSIIFGVTADLLLTGYWFRDLENNGDFIRRKLISYASEKGSIGMCSPVFARDMRFEPLYRAWLASQLSRYVNFGSLHTRARVTRGPVHISIASSIARPSCFCSHYGPSTVLRLAVSIGEEELKKALQHLEHDYVLNPFSSNSRTGVAEVMAMTYDESYHPLKVFFKTTTIEKQRLEEKIWGKITAFYPFIQKPLNLESVACYPYLDFSTQSQLHAEYMHKPSENGLTSMIDIEMRKSEDTLRAYRESFQSQGCGKYMAEKWQIHRFFWLRLAQEERFARWYKDGIVVDGHRLQLEEFTKLTLCVNGKRYSSFGDLHALAQSVLAPTSFSDSPIVFGLGDAHGGNVMISSEGSPLPGEKLLYIDYEVSGFHSPFLDLAKPLYNDVFFAALYADLAPAKFSVNVRLENDCLFIDTRCQEDSLALAILRIKRHFLIEPLCKTLVENSVDLARGVQILVNALFACALLTRNFVDGWDQLFVNLAIGTSLSSCRTFEDIWQTCTELLSPSCCCEYSRNPAPFSRGECMSTDQILA